MIVCSVTMVHNEPVHCTHNSDEKLKHLLPIFDFYGLEKIMNVFEGKVSFSL